MNGTGAVCVSSSIRQHNLWHKTLFNGLVFIPQIGGGSQAKRNGEASNRGQLCVTLHC
jgi:hypothetical protein